MSNFNWTDKDSVKWFLLLPQGHQGPYSLQNLFQMDEQNKIAKGIQVWAEGLPAPVNLQEALINAGITLPLPPLPEDDIPPMPVSDIVESAPVLETPKIPQKKNLNLWIVVTLIILSVLIFICAKFISTQEKVKIKRHSKMTLELQNRIEQENSFSSWDKKLFFKEYVPQDHSLIWLATSSFQECDVEATFNSVQGKLLAFKDEKVSFKTSGHLSHHLVEFSKLDFNNGQKIIPGLYEVDIKASQCHWQGTLAKLMNIFRDAETEYMARIKVILFSRGPEEFNRNLETLLKKKLELELRQKSENDLFWQDLKQKMDTLEAITLQIEQLFLDHVQTKPDVFMKNLKQMTDEYTRKYGSFLTSFVVENENYFKNHSGDATKKNYELMVRMLSKKIGLESMKFIEEFQKLKKAPTAPELNKYSVRIKTVFLAVKKDITQKITQLSADRAK